MKKRLSFHLAIAAILATLGVVALSGCSVFSTIGGWFSQGYENTTAYFNAYYNAKRIFDDAEAEVLSAALTARSKTTQTPQTGQISAGAKQKFNQVIDKCSNILSFYQESAVVDDALFLIGKSYYYQGEFVKAERKFSELLAQFPGGPLAFIGQLWFLRTLEKLNRYDDALAAGEALVRGAKEAGEEDIAGEAYCILGSILTAQDLAERAIEQYAKAVEVSGDGRLQATAQSKIGDLFLSLHEYDKAASAYLKVLDYSPDDYLLYYSRLQAALAFRSLKKKDTTIALLNELADDYRFNEHIGTTHFELGATYAQSERMADAVNEYRFLDTTFARTETGAKAAFELGNILQSRFGDYRAAMNAYARAGGSPAASVASEAQRRASALTKYFQFQSQFAMTDSVLYALDIDSLWIRRDTLSRGPVADTVNRDAHVVTAKKDTSLVPRDSTGLAQGADSLLTKPDSSAFIIRKPNRDSLVVALSRIAFQLGEVFHSELEVPDSAFFWYQQSLKLHADSARAPRTLFTLAEIMRADSAKKYGDEREMYNRLIKEYPASRDAEDARIALGLQSARTRMDPAIAAYAQAESLVEGRQYERALTLLGSIVEEHSSSPFAAKSKYTMGWIYEHYLSNPDSALSQYKQVAERFGSTEYGAAARRRLPSPLEPPPGAAPADTLTKVSPQQGLHELQKRELGVDEKERVIKAPSDTTSATRGKRKVVVD